MKEKLSKEHEFQHRKSDWQEIGTFIFNLWEWCYKIHLTGGNIGLKNLSKQFERNFLRNTKKTKNKNTLPFSLLANKVSAKQWHWNIIGICLILWDISSSQINRYLNQTFCSTLPCLSVVEGAKFPFWQISQPNPTLLLVRPPHAYS